MCRRLIKIATGHRVCVCLFLLPLAAATPLLCDSTKSSSARLTAFQRRGILVGTQNTVPLFVHFNVDPELIEFRATNYLSCCVIAGDVWQAGRQGIAFAFFATETAEGQPTIRRVDFVKFFAISSCLCAFLSHTVNGQMCYTFSDEHARTIFPFVFLSIGRIF